MPAGADMKMKRIVSVFRSGESIAGGCVVDETIYDTKIIEPGSIYFFSFEAVDNIVVFVHKIQDFITGGAYHFFAFVLLLYHL